MKNFEFGLKLWSTNTDLISQATQLIDEKIFDYIELFVVPGTRISPFMIDIPYIIHIPHHKFGVNIGEASKQKQNLQKINESIEWADKLNARYLILHPGYGLMKDAEELLQEISDNRFLIENMPKVGLDGESMIGYSPGQIQELIHGCKMGFCLDLGHAVKASISLKLGYKEILSDFLKIKPKLFHICDGDIENGRDSHLNIRAGSFDMQYFKECIENNSSKLITLETPRNNHLSLEEDLRNINILESMWNL